MDCLLQSLYLPCVGMLERYDTPARSCFTQQHIGGLYQFPRLIPHKIAVCLEKRLTLRSVDDNRLNCSIVFCMSRKSGAAAADNSGLIDKFSQLHIIPPYPSLSQGNQ